MEGSSAHKKSWADDWRPLFKRATCQHCLTCLHEANRLKEHLNYSAPNRAQLRTKIVSHLWMQTPLQSINNTIVIQLDPIDR
eukprot:7162525-Karenia_brevis.AAC.1